MTNHDDDTHNDKTPPQVANLKSGLGETHPDRYQHHPYPPHWTR